MPDFATAIEWRVLAAFMNAATRVPAYIRFLEERGIEAGKVRSLADFAATVPPTSKALTFASNDIADLCVDGAIGDASGAYTSSGYSGEFSFGLETTVEAEALKKRVDRMLAHHFAADRRRTMVVNALPMGVRVPSGIAMVIDTGTRADAVLAAVRKLAPKYEQVVIVAEQPFLKKVAEDGEDLEGFRWRDYVINVVTGAEVMPENYRTYIEGILGHDPADPSRGVIVVSFGISELGLSIGQETAFCRTVRRRALHDRALREALFGDKPFLPTFVQWSPLDYWLETVEDEDGRGRLVVTTLDLNRTIPLIRYGTGDWAEVMTPGDVLERAQRAGVHLPAPEVPLPFVAIWGRGRRAGGATGPYPEEIKEILYGHPQLARLTTGGFRLTGEGNELAYAVHLKGGQSPDQAKSEFAERALSEMLGVPVRVQCLSGIEPSFQRKFQYC